MAKTADYEVAEDPDLDQQQQLDEFTQDHGQHRAVNQTDLGIAIFMAEFPSWLNAACSSGSFSRLLRAMCGPSSYTPSRLTSM